MRLALRLWTGEEKYELVWVGISPDYCARYAQKWPELRIQSRLVACWVVEMCFLNLPQSGCFLDIIQTTHKVGDKTHNTQSWAECGKMLQCCPGLKKSICNVLLQFQSRKKVLHGTAEKRKTNHSFNIPTSNNQSETVTAAPTRNNCGGQNQRKIRRRSVRILSEKTEKKFTT